MSNQIGNAGMVPAVSQLNDDCLVQIIDEVGYSQTISICSLKKYLKGEDLDYIGFMPAKSAESQPAAAA